MKKILQSFILIFLLTTILPTGIYGEELNEKNSVAYSEKEGKRTYYRTIVDAVNAGMSTGLLITMSNDWTLTSPMNVVEGRTLKIEMNGHSIRRLDFTSRNYSSVGHVIVMHANSKLYLYGNNVPNCTFHISATSFRTEREITSGGLVYGGVANDGGGIYMKKKSELHLENTAIGVNYAKNGGGIYVDGQDCQIYLDKGAKITQNDGEGGGIYSNADGTHIHLNGSSSIDNNNIDGIGDSGGGIYFNYSWFSVESEDKTGAIRNNNSTQNGGGIYVCSKFWGSNNGTIKNLIIENNKVDKNGGGVYIDQNNITIENCIIRDNESYYNGGGVYSNGKTTIKSSTITGNKCNQGPIVNNNDEGGGVYAASGYDIKITGSTVIRNNYRMNPNKIQWWNPEMGGVHLGNYKSGYYGYSDDDVFLGSSSVYILANGLDAKTSLIGIRTGDLSDRVVVKNFDGFSWGHTFFFNLANNFHFGTANNDTELWQRKGVDKYTVRINGKSVGTYNFEQEVTINGNTKTAIFKSWECSNFDLTDKQKENPVLKFKMPGYDVDLTAVYTTSSAEDVVLTVEAPVVGTNLYVIGSLSWTTNDVGHKYSTYLTWLELQADGTYKEVSGVAKANTTYAVKATIEKDGSKFLMFEDTDTSKVKVVYKNAKNESVDYASASVDTNGSLNIQGKGVQTLEGTYKLTKAFQTIKVEEGTSKEDLLKMFPNSVSASNDLSSTTFVDFIIDKNSINVDSIISDGVVVKPANNIFTLKAKVVSQDGIKLASDTVTFYINVIDKAVDINEIPDTTIYVNVGDDVNSLIAKLKDVSKVTVTGSNGNKYILNSRFIANTKLTKIFTDSGLVNNYKVVAQDADYVFEREMYASFSDNLNLNVNKARFIIKVSSTQSDTSNDINIEDESLLTSDEMDNQSIDEVVNYDNQIALTSMEDAPAVVDETSNNVHTYDGGYGLPSVNVSKEEGTYNSTNLTSDEDDKLSLSVELSPSESIDSLKIYYNLYSTDGRIVQTNVEYKGSITLSAEKGEYIGYVLETWTDLEGEKGDIQTLNYVIDNSTRTITVITNYVEDGTQIEEPKVLTYAYGEEDLLVNVPIIENHEIFSWVYVAGGDNESAGQNNENGEYTLTIEKLTSNATLTISYYPVVTKLSLNFDSLVVGNNLPSVSSIIATLSNGETKDVTGFFDLENVEWYSNDITTVKQDSTYVAKLKIKDDDVFTKYSLSDDGLVLSDNDKYSTIIYSDDTNSYAVFIFDTYKESDSTLNIDYSIDSLEVLPYSDVTYENALSAGSLVDAYNIPTKLSAILIDNNTNEVFTYDLDVVWDDNFTMGFEPNNANSQQLIIKGKLALPNYIHNPNGLDETITLTINVLGKDSYKNKVLTCEESMGSLNWTWSESKKACVYRVSNTSVE